MPSDSRTLSEEELARHDGKQGRPAYVAHDGAVYDLSGSKLWVEGKHMNRHEAGQDLTASLSAAPHGIEKLQRYPRIGRLGKVKAAQAAPPRLVRRLLALHPHPMSVHFPIALTLFGGVFAALYWLDGHESLQTTSFYLIIAASGMLPCAMAAGLFSWWFDYGHRFTRIFTAKIILSFALEILLLLAVSWRLHDPGLLALPLEPSGAAFLVLIFFLAPVVMTLGYLGGRITFPR